MNKQALSPTLSFYKNKTVCVTGAGGSIGTELCYRLLCSGIKELRLVSLTEAGLYNVMKLLKRIADAEQIKLVGVLGSVTDFPLMVDTLVGCDIVLHAAAHKHVPICEDNPLAAITNNVMGTYSIARASLMAKVGTFVLISSDKAVKPKSIMGATKRAAERILSDVMPERQPTRFITVRFGNVLDSAGSVLPLWREQLKTGNAPTLTHQNCERYFMSIPDAVELVVHAATMHFGDTFVFDMGDPVNMFDLAMKTIRKHRPDIEDPRSFVKITGLRPGEKLTEELDYGGERRPTDHPKIFSIEEGHLPRLDIEMLQQLSAVLAQRNREVAVAMLWDIVS